MAYQQTAKARRVFVRQLEDGVVSAKIRLGWARGIVSDWEKKVREAQKLLREAKRGKQ